MKKFMLAPIMVFAALFLVSCSNGETLDDLIDTTVDTETADTTDTVDTTDTTDTSDTSDTADTGDTGPDTGDTGADTGDSDNNRDNTDSGNISDNDPADSDNDDDTDSDSDDVEISDNDQENSGDDNDSTDSGSDNDADNDSGDSDNDSDSTDSGNDSDSDNPEAPDSDCVGISIDWNSFVLYEGAFRADAIIGDPDLEDGFSIEFNRNKINVEPYDLGETKTKNRQYRTCEECVMVYMDCEDPYIFYPDNCAAYFFQESGTLNVTANDDATDKEGNIEGTLSAKLIEVELSGTEYDIDSTPVTNGRCVEIESGGTFKSTKECREIILEPTNLTYNSSYNRYETSYTPGTGNIADIIFPQGSPLHDDLAKDYFTMQLRNFNSSVENYSLAGRNYGDTNGIFFVIYEDSGEKYYFQKKGTINYNASTKKVQLNGVILEEVTINGSTNKSTRVPYGACLKVTDTTLSY